MNVHDLAVARLARETASPRPPATEGGGLAKVYELQAARRSRSEQIPDAVLAQVDAAAQLYDELQATGQHLRFGLHDLSGRVVVDLTDLDGKVLRPISLTDAVTAAADPELDPAA